MNVKPFDLAAALRGERVVTRDGREVEGIYCFHKAKRPDSVIAIIDGKIKYFYKNGRYYSGATEHSYDLFMATKKETYWMNIYFHIPTLTIVSGRCFDIEKLAVEEKCVRHDRGSYLKTISFEIEE